MDTLADYRNRAQEAAVRTKQAKEPKKPKEPKGGFIRCCHCQERQPISYVPQRGYLVRSCLGCERLLAALYVHELKEWLVLGTFAFREHAVTACRVALLHCHMGEYAKVRVWADKPGHWTKDVTQELREACR